MVGALRLDLPLVLPITYMSKIALIEMAGRHITDKSSSPRFEKKQV